MRVPQHPVSEVAAAFYHGCIAAFLFIGLLFHGAAAVYAAHLYMQVGAKMIWMLVTLAFYHGIVAGFLVIGLAFHAYACSRHWYDRFRDVDTVIERIRDSVIEDARTQRQVAPLLRQPKDYPASRGHDEGPCS